MPISEPAPTSNSVKASARKRLRADRNGVLVAAGIMAGVGWVLLYRIVESSPPLALQRWLFLILLYTAVTGTALPFIWYLNQRFSRRYPVSGGTLLRQGMWCGLFAVTAAWLQMTRALNTANAFFLALSMIVIETFLRLRERSQAIAYNDSSGSTSRAKNPTA